MRNRLLFYVMALVILGCVVLFGTNSASAGTIDLPKTGQTTCYDSEGDVISCEGTGQDGDIRAGVAWPAPRFTDNGDGTVSDNLTGIMWLKDAGCLGSTTWESALRKVNDFNVKPRDYACWEYNGTYNDWVLPNVNELDSLNNSEKNYSGTWLEDQGFVNVHQSHDYYWSSTTDASSANYWPTVPAWYAWAVDIRGSYLKRERKDSHYYHIWPMRTGQTGSTKIPKTGQTTSYADGDDGDLQRGAEWPVPRFTDNGDGTVTDNLTGLIWLKGACFQNKTWQEALDAIADFNDNPESLNWCGGYTGTYNDWRLPNKNELRSLTDFSQYRPALPSGHPFLYIDTDCCWTSTTSAILEEYGWVVDMNYGEVGHDGKGWDFIALPVRAGKTGLSIPLPNSQESFTYPPAADPAISSVASAAKPVGVGAIATGGKYVSLRVSTGQFSGAVDIYFGIYIPAIDPNNIYILTSDYNLRPLSQAGLAPWKANTNGPINEHIFGDISTSDLPAGKYTLYLMAALAGNPDIYYLWSTYFEISEGGYFPTLCANWPYSDYPILKPDKFLLDSLGR